MSKSEERLPEVLTVKEVAIRLRVSQSTVGRMLAAGTLRGINTAAGKKKANWRIPRASFEALVQGETPKAPAVRVPTGIQSFV